MTPVVKLPSRRLALEAGIYSLVPARCILCEMHWVRTLWLEKAWVQPAFHSTVNFGSSFETCWKLQFLRQNRISTIVCVAWFFGFERCLRVSGLGTDCDVHDTARFSLTRLMLPTRSGRLFLDRLVEEGAVVHFVSVTQPANADGSTGGRIIIEPQVGSQVCASSIRSKDRKYGVQRL